MTAKSFNSQGLVMGHAIKLAGLELAHPVMNAAGTCKLPAEGRQFAASSISAVVAGSYTVRKRQESFGTFYLDPAGRFSLNSMGLPNLGSESLELNLPLMRMECCEEFKKPLILNIAGTTPEEFAALAKIAVAHKVSALEVNLSCPTGPAPIYYQREPTALVVNAVNSVAFGKIPLLYKLGPITDPILFRDQVELIMGKGTDGFVVANTLGGGMYYLPGIRRPVMRRPMGVGGAALLPIGLGMVAQLRELAPDRIDIVGVGGITTSADVQQYLAAGASAVQAGTLCWAADRDPAVYHDLVATRP